MECTDFREFSEMALDHAMHPRNYGSLSVFEGHAGITGPCGDTMEFWLSAQDRRIRKVIFITDGCGSSLSCGSMATCLAEGRELEKAHDVSEQDILEALGSLPKEWEHCAFLAATALRKACDDNLAGERKTSSSGTDKNLKSRGAGGKSECSAVQRKPGEIE